MKRSRRTRRERQTAPPRSSRRFIPLAAAGIVFVAALAVAVLIVRGGDSGSSASSARAAVIVDQLSLTQPNPGFVSAARSTLSRAGYSVDYVGGEDVTVDFYRRLPAQAYDLVVLRVHAGITTEVDAESGQKEGTEYVSLFTGEKYDEGKYPVEQLNRLGRATYYEGAEPLFGIGPEFVARSMQGDFSGAIVVMMGCDGLRSQRTAEAFLDRGAGAFVSWSKPVSAPHTDEATVRLLDHLLLHGLEVEAAVEATAAEVGPDPTYEGELRVLTRG